MFGGGFGGQTAVFLKLPEVHQQRLAKLSQASMRPVGRVWGAKTTTCFEICFWL